ncbi:MAG: hypothetical protein PHW34_13540 [Hespellia sp.]|nr:hypothetical protein [Hespellia sp.]
MEILVIDDKVERKNELALKIVEISDTLEIYAHVIKTDSATVAEFTNWEQLDAIFMRISGLRKDVQDFKCADIIRSKNKQMLMVFYSEVLENEVAKQLFSYYPMSYMEIPLDNINLRAKIKAIYERKEPYKLLIKEKERWIRQEMGDILYFDTKNNVVYTDRRIKLSDRKDDYMQYVRAMLERAGFCLVEGRYWVNRFWRESVIFQNNEFKNDLSQLMMPYVKDK